jgi:hypothetical protein
MQEYLDEDNILHMCEKCRSILISGDPDNRIIVTYLYTNPPEGTNFVICPDCS